MELAGHTEGCPHGAVWVSTMEGCEKEWLLQGNEDSSVSCSSAASSKMWAPATWNEDKLDMMLGTEWSVSVRSIRDGCRDNITQQHSILWF